MGAHADTLNCNYAQSIVLKAIGAEKSQDTHHFSEKSQKKSEKVRTPITFRKKVSEKKKSQRKKVRTPITFKKVRTPITFKGWRDEKDMGVFILFLFIFFKSNDQFIKIYKTVACGVSQI